MSYVVLARKWRPKKFSEMVGQEHVLRALANALDTGKVHHAFLFTGTRGVGKTTVARILAKSLNCEVGVGSNPCGVCAACREIDEGRFVDLIEVDAASRTKVDDTRDLLDRVQYAPTRGRYKVYLIDEVHMLSTHSFNALLKTLEEPPPHVKFLLATTDPQKLPVTVLSRCLQFSLKRLSAAMIGERLRFIAGAEELRSEPAALALIARAADGSLRDALSLLDQCIAFGGGDLSEKNARAMLGTIDRRHVVRLVEDLSRADGPAMLATIHDLDQDVPDYDRALVELAAYLQRIAIVQVVPESAQGESEFADADLSRLAGALSAEDVQLYYQIAVMGRRDLNFAPDPRSGFEMTLLRMLAFRPEAGADAARPAAARPAGAARAEAGPAPSAGTSAMAGAFPRPVTAMTGSGNAPAAPFESPAAAAPSPPPPVDAAHWPEIVEAAGLSGMVRQFALNCVPTSFAADVLHLGIDEVAAERRTKQIEERLAQGLGRYFGREVRIMYESTRADLVTPAKQRALAEQDQAASASTAFMDDPAVKGLRERFGGEVDGTSIKPGN